MKYRYLTVLAILLLLMVPAVQAQTPEDTEAIKSAADTAATQADDPAAVILWTFDGRG